MGWDFTRTPEGKIAIWSTIVDDIIFEGTEEEAVEFYWGRQRQAGESREKGIILNRTKDATVERYRENMHFRVYCDEGHEDECALNFVQRTEDTVCMCSARPGKKLGEP